MERGQHQRCSNFSGRVATEVLSFAAFIGGSARFGRHGAFRRVRRKNARLQTEPFVVGQFIARLLPNHFLKLHEIAPTSGVRKSYLMQYLSKCRSTNSSFVPPRSFSEKVLGELTFRKGITTHSGYTKGSLLASGAWCF